jgi:N-acetylglucosamine-6-phosphate deacetylase
MAGSGALIIRGGRVLLPDGSLAGLDVAIRGGRIAELGPGLRGEEELEAGGAFVLPGLIELHTHGIRTLSTESSSLAEYARVMAERGVTTFYPTLFCSPQRSAEHLRRHRAETDELRLTPQVGGFRLEAPYLAIASGGSAGALAEVRPETTELLLEAGGGLVKIWDFSPELPGAVEAIRRLSRLGVVCSLAHTKASRAQGRAVVEAGARLVTHLFDVFYHLPESSDPDPDMYAPGLVDYLLIEDRLTCELIADGTHVDPVLVEEAFRCKPPSGLVFVTDSNYGAGLPPGRYTLPGDWGDVQVGEPNQGVRLPDRGMILAGSALTPIDSFRNVLRLFGKDLATASRVWSANQARLLGLNKGEIAAGRDADLIVVDAQLELLCTIAAGKIVYRRSAAVA